MEDSTIHYLVIGDCTHAGEIQNLPEVDLLVTSPPYFNAPFDYDDLYESYESFLNMVHLFGKIFFEKLKKGAIAAINIDDMLIKGIKYPIIADTMKIFSEIGYIIHGRIVWKKPDGYIRISQRSGVFLQNPYPMYFYPDNLIENIIIFQKPDNIDSTARDLITETDVWEMTNVLPIKARLEEKIAAFPSILPEKLIILFTEKQQYVCDPFLGSGTTMKAARDLKRNSIGIEIQEHLIPIIRKKTGFTRESLNHFLLPDKLHVIKLKNTTKIPIENRFVTFLKTSLITSENEDLTTGKYHLVILNILKLEDTINLEENSDHINLLHHGRVILVYYNPDLDSKNVYSYIFDFMLKRGIRFRDKITVWHQPSSSFWRIPTNNNIEVEINHTFFEILIFQKGKFNYKSKTKEEKLDSSIDKNMFQKGNYFLSIWDFRQMSKEESIKESYSRLIPLFLFNGEVIASNSSEISCKDRNFRFERISFE